MIPRTDAAKAWWSLSFRHVDISEALLPAFPDAAFFHVYHAAECAVTASLLTLSPNEPVLGLPHRDKYFALFDRLGTESGVGRELSALWPRLDRRNEALYVGWIGQEIREPQRLFRSGSVSMLLAEVRALLHRLRKRVGD